jgi:hypothetical protein
MLDLLVVGSNVTPATGLVSQDTILKGEGEHARKLTSLEVTLVVGGGLVDSLDLESSRGGGSTTRRTGCLGVSQCGGRKGEGDVGLHCGWGGINVLVLSDSDVRQRL